jgi:ferredoxin/flavodoxin
MADDQQEVLVAFFSGTGGVQRIADTFEEELKKRNTPVFKHSLDSFKWRQLKANYDQIITNIQRMILIYPVHAFNAPLLIFQWIAELPEVKNIPVAVISVSGGGEHSLNTACRVDCIKALERKGFDVFYEKMMIMPSNWVIPTPDHLAIRLIRCIPDKVNQILDQVLLGERRRIKPKPAIRIAASFISRLEKYGAKKAGQGYKTSETCAGCAWCAKNCPTDNIQMMDGRPKFGKKCIMCFRCIYGCPNHSIYATRGKFMVIKAGFDLAGLEKRMASVELEPIEKCIKGTLFHGLGSYLLNKEKCKPPE